MELPQLMRLVDNAVQGAQRGAALTQRMLAFARRQELKLEPVDIPALVRGMTELLKRSIGPTISIEARFPLSLARVTADFNQLEMALLNLMVNARDAMPNGGGAIVVSARPAIVAHGEFNDLDPGDYVCLSVVDTGEGMDEATLARAMDPFFTTKEPGGDRVGIADGAWVSPTIGWAAPSEESQGRRYDGRTLASDREGALRGRPGQGRRATGETEDPTPRRGCGR